MKFIYNFDVLIFRRTEFVTAVSPKPMRDAQPSSIILANACIVCINRSQKCTNSTTCHEKGIQMRTVWHWVNSFFIESIRQAILVKTDHSSIFDRIFDFLTLHRTGFVTAVSTEPIKDAQPSSSIWSSTYVASLKRCQMCRIIHLKIFHGFHAFSLIP